MSSFSTKISNFLRKFAHPKENDSNALEIVIESEEPSAIETHNKQLKSHKECPTFLQPIDIEYCSFVVRYYQSLGFTVWEYNKETDLSNSEIHLVIKKEQNIFLIQCRNDQHNLNKENIQNFEEESNHFIAKHEIFKQYNIKLLYTMSSLQLDETAYKYIKSSNNIDYEILKARVN